MSAEVIAIGKVARRELPSANEAAHLDGFCKGLLTVKSLLKCSPSEIIIAVNNLLAARLLSADEVRALADFYGWEMPK